MFLVDFASANFDLAHFYFSKKPSQVFFFFLSKILKDKCFKLWTQMICLRKI